MNEIWKDIKDYEGLYQVSNLGRVKSLEKEHKINNNKTYLLKEKILKNMIDKNGYNYVHLSKNNIQKRKAIHRLVMEAFIPNINNLPCINHKDENKTNNCIDNLEWCSYSYNNNYGTKKEKQSLKIKNNIKRSKKVIQYSLQKSIINEYPSLREAERQTNIKYTDILRCYKGKRKTAGGYIWKYKK